MAQYLFKLAYPRVMGAVPMQEAQWWWKDSRASTILETAEQILIAWDMPTSSISGQVEGSQGESAQHPRRVLAKLAHNQLEELQVLLRKKVIQGTYKKEPERDSTDQKALVA